MFLLKGNKPSSSFVGRNIMKLLSSNMIFFTRSFNVLEYLLLLLLFLASVFEFQIKACKRISTNFPQILDYGVVMLRNNVKV